MKVIQIQRIPFSRFGDLKLNPNEKDEVLSQYCFVIADETDYNDNHHTRYDIKYGKWNYLFCYGKIIKESI